MITVDMKDWEVSSNVKMEVREIAYMSVLDNF